MSSMKPCPFCGNDNVGVVSSSTWDASVLRMAVHCQKCGGSGPAIFTSVVKYQVERTKDEVVAKWNKRAVSQEEEGRWDQVAFYVGQLLGDLKRGVPQAEDLWKELSHKSCNSS